MVRNSFGLLALTASPLQAGRQPFGSHLSGLGLTACYFAFPQFLRVARLSYPFRRRRRNPGCRRIAKPWASTARSPNMCRRGYMRLIGHLGGMPSITPECTAG